jgi:hypothetical protein
MTYSNALHDRGKMTYSNALHDWGKMTSPIYRNLLNLNFYCQNESHLKIAGSPQQRVLIKKLFFFTFPK